MLTGYQAEVIAFGTDGGFVCVEHIVAEYASDDEDLYYWDRISELEDASGYTAYSRYSLEESFPEGLYCDDCGTELVEPSEDYCSTHDAWRAYDQTGDTEDGKVDHCTESEGGDDEDPCSFPDDADPNPPAPRWTPCSVCGAGDGERHDTLKHFENSENVAGAEVAAWHRA